MSTKRKGRRSSTRRDGKPRTAPDTGPQAAKIRVNVPRPNVTEYNMYTLVPDLEGKPEADPVGSPGRHTVTFILGVPGVSSVVTSMDIDELLNSGDSLFETEGLQLSIGPEPGSATPACQFLPNANRRLARIVATVDAAHFSAAERKAYDVVMPALSLMAVTADVPVEVRATILRNEQSQAQRFGMTIAGQIRQLPEIEGLSDPELRALVAAYREGLNTTSPTFQSLCFWKVMEGAESFYTKRVRALKRKGLPKPEDPMAEIISASHWGAVPMLSGSPSCLHPGSGHRFSM